MVTLIVFIMADSSDSLLLAYARCHGLAEDPTALPTCHLAGKACEPQPLIPTRVGLVIPTPEKRMKEVHDAFCKSVLEEPLRGKAEDVPCLREALMPKPAMGNVWRGLLPTLRTSDLAPVPLLNTFNEDEPGPASTYFLPWRSVSQIGSPARSRVPDEAEEEIEDDEDDWEDALEGEEDDDDDDDDDEEAFFYSPGVVLPIDTLPGPVMPQPTIENSYLHHGQPVPSNLLYPVRRIASVNPTTGPSGMPVSMVPEMIEHQGLMPQSREWSTGMDETDRLLRESVEHLHNIMDVRRETLELANAHNNPWPAPVGLPFRMNPQVCTAPSIST